MRPWKKSSPPCAARSTPSWPAPPERASTLVRRFDAFEALRSRARLYRDVLSVQVQNLDQHLDQLALTVEQMLEHRQKAA